MTADDNEARLLALAVGVVQLFLEAEAGRRPRAMVERVFTGRLAAKLGPVWFRPGPARRASVARGEFLGPGRFEAAVLARTGSKAGVVIVRLERRKDGWRVTELARPEDGVLPEPQRTIEATEQATEQSLVRPELAHKLLEVHLPPGPGHPATAREGSPTRRPGRTCGPLALADSVGIALSPQEIRTIWTWSDGLPLAVGL